MSSLNVGIKTDERDILNNRACQLADEGNIDEAIRIFTDLHATAPDDIRTLSNLATVLGKSGRYDESLDLFEKIVSRAPGMLSSRICYINLLTYRGEHKRALECYRQMPRPGAVESMMLGSLSEEFKRRNSRSSKGIAGNSDNKKELKAKDENPAETAPRLISLIRSGPPQI